MASSWFLFTQPYKICFPFSLSFSFSVQISTKTLLVYRFYVNRILNNVLIVTSRILHIISISASELTGLRPNKRKKIGVYKNLGLDKKQTFVYYCKMLHAVFVFCMKSQEILTEICYFVDVT